MLTKLLGICRTEFLPDMRDRAIRMVAFGSDQSKSVHDILKHCAHLAGPDQAEFRPMGVDPPISPT